MNQTASAENHRDAARVLLRIEKVYRKIGEHDADARHHRRYDRRADQLNYLFVEAEQRRYEDEDAAPENRAETLAARRRNLARYRYRLRLERNRRHRVEGERTPPRPQETPAPSGRPRSRARAREAPAERRSAPPPPRRAGLSYTHPCKNFLPKKIIQQPIEGTPRAMFCQGCEGIKTGGFYYL